MKSLKAYNTEALNRFYRRKVHNNEDDPPEPSVPDPDLSDLPESCLDIAL